MILQHLGTTYQSWAIKLQFRMVEKDLHTVVCEFKGRAQEPCPVVIERLTQGELKLLPGGAKNASEHEKMLISM